MKPIRGGLLLGVAVALSALGIGPTSSWATYPGANGRIAYAGHAGPEGADHSHIFTVLPTGTGLKQLTDADISDGQPSWSADGRRLTFVRPSYYTSQVFTMRADGSKVRRVTHDSGMDSSPNFSPTGGRIVYSKEVALFTIRSDGTDRQQIITGQDLNSPSYSPNGRQIVFGGLPDGKTGSGSVWTIRPNGSHLRRLTHPRRYGSGRLDQFPDWSPDGQHIVYQRCEVYDFSCEGDLYVMRADGSFKHRIRTLYGNIPPTYSPAGDRIALERFVGDRYYVECSDIFTVGLAGSDEQAVTGNCEDPSDGGYAGQPSWQPIPPG